MQQIKKTKIIATVGPSCWEDDQLVAMTKAGVNAFRLNMSHFNRRHFIRVITVSRRIARNDDRALSIIADLQGPKIRLGILPDTGIKLEAGQKIKIQLSDKYQDGILPSQFDFFDYIAKGDRVLLRDGQIQLEVTKVDKKSVDCKALNTGIVFSRQGINLPDTIIKNSSITSKDLEDIEFAIENNVDYIALSFVQEAKDVEQLRQILKRHNAEHIGIISKIETQASLKGLESIIVSSDAVMVARGDLGAETPIENVPMIQKRIIRLARLSQKPVIVATQMLESMINSPLPTRAEVSDIANAVIDQADCLMLSGETAAGYYPIEVVSMMKKTILATEANLDYQNQPQRPANQNPQLALAEAATSLAQRLDLKVMIASTSSGTTARNLSSLRPGISIYTVTHNRRLFNQMAIVWGTKSILCNPNQNGTRATIDHLLKNKIIKPGEIVVSLFGKHKGESGGTDTIRLFRT
ncbi:pyruvate kinase [Candidatus Saccharibacteria bacterium]|nr:pyruvate kinase [Candidatus Saccharibacteria bacterium]MCB9834533.1 pyruvate kinase [Candidatus Nomurabacteria bacterium]